MLNQSFYVARWNNKNKSQGGFGRGSFPRVLDCWSRGPEIPSLTPCMRVVNIV